MAVWIGNEWGDITCLVVYISISDLILGEAAGKGRREGGPCVRGDRVGRRTWTIVQMFFLRVMCRCPRFQRQTMIWKGGK